MKTIAQNIVRVIAKSITALWCALLLVLWFSFWLVAGGRMSARAQEQPPPHTQQAYQAHQAQQTQQPRTFQTKPTRKQILAMKFDDLSALSLEELTELASIVGVSSVDELLKLLVNTASKTDERLNDAPGVISVVTARELELFGARTLTDALNYVVSVQIYCSPLFQSNVTMRGDLFRSLTSKHILILINGRPLRESLFSGIYPQVLNGFPLASVERIEVMRGPGSVLYGTNAFTGTINVITKTTDGVVASVQGGSFGTLAASLHAGTSFKTALGDATVSDGNITLSALYNNNAPDWTVSFGLRPAMGRPPQVIQHTPYQSSVSGLLTASLGGLKAQAFVTDYRASTFGAEASRPPTELRNTTINADVGYTHSFSDVLSASLNGTLNRYETRHADQLLSTDGLAELTLHYKPVKAVALLVGGLLQSRNGQQNTVTSGTVVVPEYNQLWWSVYGEAEWQPFESLKLRAGAQLNKAVNIPLDVSPRLAAIWHVTPEFGVKAFYGQAFRAAVGFENFSQVQSGLGNPRLRPETNESVDGEVFWERENVRLSVVYYRAWQDSLIMPRNIAPMGAPPMNVHQNLGNAGFQLEGAEFEAKYAPSNELYVLASVSYQTNLDEGPGMRNVTMLPTWAVKTGVSYDTKNGITASLFGIFNSTPVVPPPPMGGMPIPQVNPVFQEYIVLSATVNCDLTELFDMAGVPHIIVNLRGENLLNSDSIWIADITRRINSLPLYPGRGVYAGISVKL